VKRYSREHLSFLRRGYKKMMVPELAQAFNRRFHENVTQYAIKSTLNNHGFLAGRKPGNPVGTLLAFTQKEAQFIKREYKRLTIADLTITFNARFNSSKTITQLKSFTSNHQIRSGRTGCFLKGTMPWNLGTKEMAICMGNSGSFKKGHVPPNRKPVDSERIDSKDGYILIKVKERNPYTGFATRWRPKHTVLWERRHGKVPKGSVIFFKDGNKRNFSDKNIVCLTRNEICRLNKAGYPYYPAEIKPSIFALMKLKVKIKAIEKAKIWL
jgi:hypothetical protein